MLFGRTESRRLASVAGPFAPLSHTHDWGDITGTPTTLAGYGISDTKVNFNTALSDGSFLFSGDADDYGSWQLNIGVGQTNITSAFALEFVGTNGIDVTYSAGIVTIDGSSVSDEYVNSLGFAVGTGILTLGRVIGADLTVDLDGRYELEFSTLPVSKGGTGAATHTSANFLTGNGTSAILSTVVFGTGAGNVSEGNHGHSDLADKTATILTKSASYTLAAGDNGKVLFFNTGSAVNLTMGTNLGAGFNVQVIQGHVTGVVTLVAGSATLNSKQVKLSSQWGGCSIVYNALNAAVAMGDLTAT